MGTTRKALLTRRELAAALDAHVRTIAKWELEGLPVAKRGARGKPSMYDEAISRAWVRAHQTEVARNRQEAERARARKDSAQAALAEQLAATRSGELVRSADVERQYFDACRMLRDRILNVPDRLADLGPVVRARIRAELRQALGKVADEVERA
jgi:phage terminase Nu1 subunit (DNA packaging protein)